ncbi:hypothetical protein [Nocardioides currus]|uniref:Uncharacterized protein n=1 Tax=Nocardioides currus TaxID=2133958 RepID=A0A2R7Z1H2_9ACTN|nr:hypothetical protein [Nocardioides currus]PUA82414.1 hypothetical protein C7S10_01295 [Nocardioides currus]
MTLHHPDQNRLAVTPALDARDVEFLSGFSPQGSRIARIWPGQPAVPSPWRPCPEGCCLVIVPTRAVVTSAGQWLRFLVGELIGDRHRVDGWVRIPGPPGRAGVLLIVEQGEVFEGELEEPGQSWSAGSTPAARAGSA